MTVDEMYQVYLDETGQTTSADVKARFKRMILRTSRSIQPFAGVEKIWEVLITPGTEIYDTVATGLSDLYRPYEGRFLKRLATDELGNYALWLILKENELSKSGVWFNAVHTMYVRPKPAEDGTLKLYGEKMLSALNFAADTGPGEVSTPEIDEDMHDIYVADACRRYGAQDEDTETAGSRYNVYAGEYERFEIEMRRRYMEKEDSRKINRKA